MTSRAGVRIAGLILLLTAAAPCSGGRFAEPEPEPAVQARLEELVRTIAAANRGEPVAAIPAMAEELLKRMGGDRASLLRQILFFLATPRGNEREMSAALLIDYYAFTNDEKISALVPHLDTDDAGLRDAVWELLSTVDRPDGGPPDFSSYGAVLNEGEREAAGLIRYMYAVSPIEALTVTARAYAGADAPGVLARAREVERYRAQPGPAGTAGLERARGQVGELASDGAWWVRLYAASVIRARPELATPGSLDRLRSDAHGLVKAAVAE